MAESPGSRNREHRRKLLDAYKRMADDWPIFAYTPSIKQDTFHRSRAGTRVLSGGNQCTVSSCPIMTYNGEIPAIAVKIGDRVVGGTVVAKYVSPEKVDIYRLKLSSGLELDANAEHPVMTRRGWVRFDALTMEDEVQAYAAEENGRLTGPFRAVASVEPIGKDYVVGFTVDPTNTYVAAGIVSHNSGKTHAGIAEDIAVAIGFRPWLHPDDTDFIVRRIDGTPMPVPNTQRLICTDFPNGLMSAIWPKFMGLCPKNAVSVRKNAQGYPTHWVFDWGSEIFVMSMEQDDMKFESGTFHSVHYDEPPRRRIRTGCLRGLMRTAGLEYFTMTPLEQDYLLDEVYANEDGRTIEIIQIRTEDNLIENGGVLSREAFDRWIKTMSEEEKEIRAHGETAHLIGKCLPKFREQSPWVPDDLDDDWSPPKSWFRVMVIDTHERKPDCVCWYGFSPDGNRCVLYDCVMDASTQGSVRRTAATIRTHESIHGVASRRIGDPRALEKNLRQTQRTMGEELAEHGVECEKAPGLRVGMGLKRINEWFDINPATGLPYLQVHRRCKKAIHEFRYLAWERKKMAYTKLAKTVGPDDHVACTRYLVTWYPIVEQETLASRVPKPKQTQLEAEWADALAADQGDGTFAGY